MEPLTLVIPTFNEAETIGGVIREIPVAYRLDIIVADVGSTHGTQAVAQAAGARVIDAGRGYGRACALGAAAAHPKSTAIAFMDGADRGDLTGEIAQSVLDGAYVLIGARLRRRSAH
jgi:glycosyltransferase involved in cell wall biosynthesis